MARDEFVRGCNEATEDWARELRDEYTKLIWDVWEIRS